MRKKILVYKSRISESHILKLPEYISYRLDNIFVFLLIFQMRRVLETQLNKLPVHLIT